MSKLLSLSFFPLNLEYTADGFSSYYKNPHKRVRNPSPKSSDLHRFHGEELANVFILVLCIQRN